MIWAYLAKMFRRRRIVQPPIPLSAEEIRLIKEAEAELPRIPDAYVPNDDNMPASVFFPRLRNRGGTGFKPISEDGSILGRAVDDANTALEINRLMEMRRPRED